MALKLKKGFTLVEMMVVLGIIAVLSLISVGALVANSNQQKLNRSVEEIVSLVRSAQNRSEAISFDPNLPDGMATKGWEFKVDVNGYKIIPLNADSNFLNEQTNISTGDQGVFPAGTTIATNFYTGNPGERVAAAEDDKAAVVFTAPFARPYVSSSYDFTRPQFSGAVPNNCAWLDGGTSELSRPAKDWYFNPDCASKTVLSPSRPGYMQIELNYKDNIVTITINSNGDIFYQ